MKFYTIFLVIILSMLIALLWFVGFTSKPHAGTCDSMKAKGNYVWNDDCTFLREIKTDTQLKKPVSPLYLSGFRSSPSLGDPLGINVWYRYRYVDAKTGGYGNFSPWTENPIIAGSKTLPCKNNDCSYITGVSSCDNNLVEVSVDSIDYKIEDGIYANVHRYVSNDGKQPSYDEDDEIVGYLFPSNSRWKYIDTNSPCKTNSCNMPPGC